MNKRVKKFKKELSELCLKYDCDISAEDHWTGYAECGKDIRITVEFNSNYNEDPPILWEELDLGRYFDGKTHNI